VLRNEKSTKIAGLFMSYAGLPHYQMTTDSGPCQVIGRDAQGRRSQLHHTAGFSRWNLKPLQDGSPCQPCEPKSRNLARYKTRV